MCWVFNMDPYKWGILRVDILNRSIDGEMDGNDLFIVICDEFSINVPKQN